MQSDKIRLLYLTKVAPFNTIKKIYSPNFPKSTKYIKRKRQAITEGQDWLARPLAKNGKSLSARSSCGVIGRLAAPFCEVHQEETLGRGRLAVPLHEVHQEETSCRRRRKGLAGPVHSPRMGGACQLVRLAALLAADSSLQL